MKRETRIIRVYEGQAITAEVVQLLGIEYKPSTGTSVTYVYIVLVVDDRDDA